jgi:nucleotide-binding universal stress UspA family protein
MYRNILVHMDGSPACAARIAAGASLAKACGATLTGVFLTSEFTPYPAIGARAIMPSVHIEAFMNERKAATQTALTAARHAFDEAMKFAGIPFYWLNLEGDHAAPLIACARRHALTIVPPAMTPVFGDHTTHAADIALHAGGPVIVMDRAGLPSTGPRRILIAWKESREAARALRDAWPLLQQATDITVLSVRRHGGHAADDVLKRHFEVHGCRAARFVVADAEDAEAAQIIRRTAADVHADMVVMGLYGRPRFMEFVLGGVSSDFLADIAAPLFLSH